MKVVFAGGGSGGHLFPLVTIIREMKKKIGDQVDFHYIGPSNSKTKEILSQENVAIHFISAGKIRKDFSFRSLLLNTVDILFRIPWGTLQSIFKLMLLNPEFIFTKGGTGSVEVTFSGWLLQIPIFMHESDIVPGWANKIANRFSVETFTSFLDTEHFPSNKLVLVGNPVRDLTADKSESQKLIGITREKKVVLILGGTIGSERINDCILSILPELISRFEVIHHCGEKNFGKIKEEALFLLPDILEKYYHPYAFLIEKRMAAAYSVADIIISRAGAGSIFEIAKAGKPSILIPLPESSQNHQLKNAYAYANSGASTVIEENNLTPHLLLEKISHLLSSALKDEMAQQAKNFARPRAAEIIANYLIEFLKQ
jgi:UDP-N-acetylglucosamine--N-acetylmuramyl-(pentapeptide) pyrophosphoryl-undecaprenol N-acetylglucosamine transferase